MAPPGPEAGDYSKERRVPKGEHGPAHRPDRAPTESGDTGGKQGPPITSTSPQSTLENSSFSAPETRRASTIWQPEPAPAVLEVVIMNVLPSKASTDHRTGSATRYTIAPGSAKHTAPIAAGLAPTAVDVVSLHAAHHCLSVVPSSPPTTVLYPRRARVAVLTFEHLAPDVGVRTVQNSPTDLPLQTRQTVVKMNLHAMMRLKEYMQ